jgi:6,7-dimethyl-8-ribityllumazine synthase
MTRMSDFTGELNGHKKRVALVVSRFNEAVTGALRKGAIDELVRLGVAPESIDTFWVPGAFDLPPVLRRVAARNEFDAIVCLGAVIRGATPHFEYVSAEAAKGVSAVAQTANCPVLFGVLTCDTEAQAWERAGGKSGNKGADVARAAIELSGLYGKIS